jgi:protein-S-isoprenylcysteine O-methyltransferase Ste14
LNRDFLSRLAVGVLFAFLSVNLLTEFVHTHHLTGLLLLASEGLVVVLTVIRRPTLTVNRSAVARVTAVLSIVGVPLLRTTDVPSALPDALTAVVSAVGLLVVVAGKLTLGRSFGIVAANRGVVASGPYRVVRHPIYLGYLITHVAFLAAHPAPMNILLVSVSDAALIIRALCEERTLVTDEKYRVYCHQVAWHFVPGVF